MLTTVYMYTLQNQVHPDEFANTVGKWAFKIRVPFTLILLNQLTLFTDSVNKSIKIQNRQSRQVLSDWSQYQMHHAKLHYQSFKKGLRFKNPDCPKKKKKKITKVQTNQCMIRKNSVENNAGAFPNGRFRLTGFSL